MMCMWCVCMCCAHLYMHRRQGHGSTLHIYMKRSEVNLYFLLPYFGTGSLTEPEIHHLG